MVLRSEGWDGEQSGQKLLQIISHPRSTNVADSLD